MTNDELLALPEAELKLHLLKYWQVSKFDTIEFSGEFEAHSEGRFGWFRRLRGMQPERLDLPFNQAALRSIFHPNNIDNIGQPLMVGRRYRFQVKLSRPDKRKTPFELIARNPRLLTEDEAALSKTITPRSTEYDRRLEVEQIFKENSHGSTAALRNSARAISGVQGDMYWAVDRFVFELLQNADDLPAQPGGSVRVQVRLLPNHLIFQHDGLPFRREHVLALANVGQSTKSADATTTGYKGIGFKSVYSKSPCVYVRSGGYSFRFASSGNNDVPWQTWPRWTEPTDYPSELRANADFFDEQQFPVSFGLQIRPDDRADYAEVLRKLFQDPRFALFLRSLDDIRVVGEDLDEIRLTRTREPDTGQITFQALGAQSTYLRHAYPVIIDAKFKPRDGADEDETPQAKLPDKLAGVDSVMVQFAAALDTATNGLVPMEPSEAVLSAYLPTEDTSYGLSLLVNADFTLTSSREKVTLKNTWNEFLFEQIGRLLIQWVADRIREDHTRVSSIYAFIPPALVDNPNQIALAEGIKHSIKNIKLLPAADDGELVLLNTAVLDKAGLYGILPDLYQGLLCKGLVVIHAAAAPGVKAAGLTTRFELQVIELSKLKAAFSHKELTVYYTPADAARLLQHLAFLEAKTVASDWQAVRWLFDQHGCLVAPNEAGVYGYLAEKWDPNFPLAAKVRYLHPDLQLVLRANEAVATWVEKDLGIAPYCRQQVVRDLLIAAVCDSATDTTIPDQGIQYLYHLYRRQELQKWLPESDTHRKKLAKARVLCADKKYYSIGGSFLSQHYAPVFALENVVEELGENEFPLISATYLEVFNEPAGWRSFWQFCEVGDPDVATILREKLVPQLTKVSSWSVSKHETVLRLALDAYCHAQAGVLGFKLNALGKLKAQTAEGIENNPVELASCHLPKAFNPSLALLDGLVNEYLPATRLADSYFKDYPAEAAARFFQETGCQVWTEAQLVEQYLTSALVEPKKLSAAENLLHTQRLQQWHSRELLSAAMLIRLRAWPLLLKSGETSAAITCYLATEYKPDLDLEVLTDGKSQQFVSASYLHASSTLEELEAWRQFLFDLKVKQTFEISYHGKLARNGPSFSLKRYYDYLDEQVLYDAKFNASRSGGKHGLQRFLFISNLDLVTSAVAARLLCEAILAFEAKLTVFEPPLYSPNEGVLTVPAPSMLSVYPVVLCTDGELRCSNEVFSAQLERVPTGRPVAALSFGSLNYERVLGLRTKLAPDDALQVLVQSLPPGAISGADTSYTMRNNLSAKLYELLPDLAALRQPDQEWTKRVLLPAANNTWVPVVGAYFIPNEEYINSASGVVLKAMPGLDTELYQQFCIALGAVLVESKDFEDEDATDQSTDWSAQFQARLASCHVLELIAHISGEAPEQVNTWRERLIELRFLQVAALRRKSKTIADYTIPTNDNNSIADGAFWFVGSLFRGHWSRLATFIVKELQLPRSVRPFLIANLLESRELSEQADVLRTQNIAVPEWLQAPIVAPEVTTTSGTSPEETHAETSSVNEQTNGLRTEQKGPDNEILEEKSITPEERKIIHEQACKAAITWLLAHNYSLPASVEEQFSVLNSVQSPEGQTIKVVVRSALKGRLFFHVYEWAELCEPGTLLLLFCRQPGADPYIVPVSNPAEQLVQANPNTYVRVPNPPLNATVLAALASDTYHHSPDFRYVFLHLPGSGAPSINLAHRQVEDILSADTSFPI